ncbi:MAG TPA: UbiD family decarboxylase [Micropepsaceae bacterium]|nr:UbiD family decarboxylase [Micropepsaceae bacterium]
MERRAVRLAKTESPRASAPESHLSDLRSTLAWLNSRGDLIESEREINPDLELTGLQKLMDGGCPAVFANVKGKPNHRLLTNLFGNIEVMNRMFGWESDRDRTVRLAAALNRPLPPQDIPQSDAPCQEVVIEAPGSVNEYLVPIRHTDLETELTVGSGIRCLSGKAFGGGTDVGYNRMNFRWGNVGTFQVSPGSHMWQVLSEAHRKRERVPLTFCFGVPPACTLLAGGAFDYVILPYGCDELGVAGAVQGFPVRLVKARTVDAMAIADSEIVLEGYVDPRDRRFETAEAEADQVQGRHHFHPEWAGYMGKSYKAPTFHVTAVTMRDPASKPLIYALGAHTLDEHNIDTSIREAAMFELCNRMQPGVIQDVNIPYCMTDWGGAIIQVKKRNRLEEGWQRNFMSALLSTSQGMRVVIAVSEDTNIYSMDDVMWAITTRVNPRTDILNPTPGGRGQTFMPAERMTAGDKEWTASNTRYEGGMGIDATVPYGYEEDFMRPQYPVANVKLEDFFSKEQIENVRGRMRGWTEWLARTGY